MRKRQRVIDLVDEAPKKVEDPENPYLTSWNDSDIVLIVEGEEFHCHHTILRLSSPVFSAMFKESFKEGLEKKAELPGKERNSFIVFLNLIYPMSAGYEAPTDRKVVRKVLEYADEYQVDSVKIHIDNILFTKIYARDDVVKHLNIAMEDLRMSEKYGLKEVRRCTYKILMADNTCCSYEETIFNELSGETKFDIITGKLREYLPSLCAIDRHKTCCKLLASISNADLPVCHSESFDSEDDDDW